jgi:glycosyltransferase involved in cell wall biosynthesis
MVDTAVFVSKLNLIVSKDSKITKFGKVIHNGLEEKEMKYFTREEARIFFQNRCKFDFSNKFIIGSIGRLAYQKNYEFLIDNFQSVKDKIPNVILVIIGNGEYFEKLFLKVVRLGYQDKIFLVGAIEDAFMYLRAFDIFTLPSRYEGLSISLLEAIFAGIPVVASDVGGNAEIVDSDQLFKLNNSVEYINKILSVRQNTEQIVTNNNRIKRRFELDKMIAEYADLYEQLLRDD